jgi:hypothetical protein
MSRAVPTLLLAAVLSLSAAAASARPLLLADNGVSLSEAAAQVQRQTGGKVIGAETVRRGDRQVHEIRVMVKPGVVKVFRVDAGGGR